MLGGDNTRYYILLKIDLVCFGSVIEGKGFMYYYHLYRNKIVVLKEFIWRRGERKRKGKKRRRE